MVPCSYLSSARLQNGSDCLNRKPRSDERAIRRDTRIHLNVSTADALLRALTLLYSALKKPQILISFNGRLTHADHTKPSPAVGQTVVDRKGFNGRLSSTPDHKDPAALPLATSDRKFQWPTHLHARSQLKRLSNQRKVNSDVSMGDSLPRPITPSETDYCKRVG